MAAHVRMEGAACGDILSFPVPDVVNPRMEGAGREFACVVPLRRDEFATIPGT